MTRSNPEHREVVPAAEGCLFAASVSACVLVVFLIVCVTGVMTVGPGQFKPIYADFDTELPTLTIWLLQVPIWLTLLFGALLAAALILKEILFHHHVINFIINLVAMVMLLLWSAAVILGLWLPLAQLMDSVQ